MMQEDDVQVLCIAAETLEHPRFAARLAEIACKPIDVARSRTFIRSASRRMKWPNADAIGLFASSSIRPKLVAKPRLLLGCCDW